MSADMKFPAVSIIILNWNGWKDTIKCLKSVLKMYYSSYHIVVIDNGSSDNSAIKIRKWIKDNLKEREIFVECTMEEVLKDSVEDKKEKLGIENFERFTLIRNKENLGFAGGNNIGIYYALHRKSPAKYVFLMNDDAEIEENTLKNLILADQEANAGVVGTVVKDKKTGEIQFSGRDGSFPLTRQFFQPIVRWTKEPPGFKDAYWTSFWVCGSGLLLRDDLLNDIYVRKKRYLDNRLFLYWEEIELCCLARKLGYKCITVKNSVIYHEAAQSSGGLYNPIAYYYQTRNKIILAGELLPLSLEILFYPLNLLLTLGRIFMNIIFKRTISARGIFCGMLDGYSGKTGKWERHDKEILNYQKYLRLKKIKDM